MIVKNEYDNMKKRLPKLSAMMDEIVVVDTGSNDGTYELCRQYNCMTVRMHEFDSFAAARNESIKHASGDWILVLDADEEILEEDVRKIRNEIQANREKAYRLSRYNYIGGGMWSVSNVIRLFQNGNGYCFERKVHETLRNSLKGAKTPLLDVYIHHFPSSTSYKNELYLSWLNDYIRDNPGHYLLKDHLASEYFALKCYDKAFGILNELIESGVRFPRIYSNLAFMYLHLKEYGQAHDAFLTAYRMLAKDAQADNSLQLDSVLSGLGIIAFEKGDYDQARSLFLEAIMHHKNAAHLYINLGLCMEKLRDYAESLRCYEAAASLNPYAAKEDIMFDHKGYENSIYSVCNVFIRHYNGLAWQMEACKNKLIRNSCLNPAYFAGKNQ